MKKTFRIAKLELSVLFYSPIAWLILVIFTVQCALSLTEILSNLEAAQYGGRELSALTRAMFAKKDAFFYGVSHRLFLYIPLLTMGLMSREMSNGSIKLLLSSPITARQIILGKFLSMTFYGLLLVGVMVLMVTIAAFSIENLDRLYIFGALLGLYLLICAYAAIGLYMSSLTNYQVVAAISTLAVLGVLEYVGNIGQSIDLVRDITYWLSIAGRSNNFVRGLISSADVIYFLLIIFLFISLAIMKLGAGRTLQSKAVVSLHYVALIIGIVVLGYISSRPALIQYLDTTRFGTQTLTESSRELLKEIDEPVHITSYANLLNSNAHLAAPRFRLYEMSQFDQYTRFLPNLSMDYVVYYDSSYWKINYPPDSMDYQALKMALAYSIDFSKALTPDDIRKQIDLSEEKNMFVRVVSYKGKQEKLRMFMDQVGYPREAEITAALRKMLLGGANVGVVTGHDERSIDILGDKGYDAFFSQKTKRSALINQGFDLKKIDLSQEAPNAESLSVLVIADPYTAYNSLELERLSEYIAQGGNLLIAVEPEKQHLLASIFSQLGVQFTANKLLQKHEDFQPEHILSRVTTDSLRNVMHVKADDEVVLPGTLGITYEPVDDYTYYPLLEADSLIGPDSSVTMVDSSMITAIALSRHVKDGTQKIVVTGDADFLSNSQIDGNSNYDFSIALFKWFSDGAYPVDTSRPEAIDNKVTVSSVTINWMKLILAIVLPALTAIFGGFILIKRTRK